MRKVNTKRLIALAFLVLFVASSVALASDVEVRGVSYPYVFDAKNTSTGASDVRAVYGRSTPQPGWGVAGEFDGGYTGVRGNALDTGAGGRRGVWAKASGGASYNYGIYAEASGTNAYAGYFTGKVYISGSVYPPSDKKLKTDVADMEGALDQVMELKPKTFRFKTEDRPEMNLPKGNHIGVLADELQQVFPDLVTQVPVPEKEEDRGKNKTPETFLAVNYIELIPVLIKAIQEQQAQIADLQYQVASLTGK